MRTGLVEMYLCTSRNLGSVDVETLEVVLEAAALSLPNQGLALGQ